MHGEDEDRGQAALKRIEAKLDYLLEETAKLRQLLELVLARLEAVSGGATEPTERASDRRH